jgi:hypothetical protein
MPEWHAADPGKTVAEMPQINAVGQSARLSYNSTGATFTASSP